MEDSFDIPVLYKGKAHSFKARLNVYGYTYKIRVELNDSTVTFEPDEEGNFRAVAHTDDLNNLDLSLIREVANSINEIAGRP